MIRAEGRSRTSVHPLWILAGFFLPAAALVFLFVWAQAREPFSADTAIRRAALEGEGLALEILDRRLDRLARAAARRPVDPSALDVAVPGLGSFAEEGIPFRVRRGEAGRIEVMEPGPPPEKKVLPLPDDALERERFQALCSTLDETEFVRKDAPGAEKILQALDRGFQGRAYRARIALIEAAYFKRHGRTKEAWAALAAMLPGLDPAAAPGPEDLPFAASALVLMEGMPGDPLPERAALLRSVAEGRIPLSAVQLRTLLGFLKTLSREERRMLLRRLHMLEVRAALQGMKALLEAPVGTGRVARLAGGRVFCGRRDGAEVTGLAIPCPVLLPRLLPGHEVAVPEEGLAVRLEDEAAPPATTPGEAVRKVPAPAGLQGARLAVYVADRALFEQAAAGRRRLFTAAALCLAVVLGVLGFATFRAVRREVEAARARSDFMAAVSHELRTPLASIRLFAELMEQGRVPGGEAGRYFRIILANCRRLSAMIENVLDMSRAAQGLPRFRCEEIDLPGLLEDLFRDIRAMAEEDGFSVETELPDALPPVRADPLALSRALFNLCDNALKYAGEEKRIVLRAAPADEGVRLEVTDFGPGIDDEEQARVFEPFLRGRAGGRTPSGVGLGLFLAREAIEGCGGRLALESRPGAGTTFFVFLPESREEEGHGG